MTEEIPVDIESNTSSKGMPRDELSEAGKVIFSSLLDLIKTLAYGVFVLHLSFYFSLSNSDFREFLSRPVTGLGVDRWLVLECVIVLGSLAWVMAVMALLRGMSLIGPDPWRTSPLNPIRLYLHKEPKPAPDQVAAEILVRVVISSIVATCIITALFLLLVLGF